MPNIVVRPIASQLVLSPVASKRPGPSMLQRPSSLRVSLTVGFCWIIARSFRQSTRKQRAPRRPQWYGLVRRASGEVEPSAESAQLSSLLSGLEAGEFDMAIGAFESRRMQLKWAALPERIVLLRHGESEGNADPSVYARKGDSLLELTDRGLQQARDAGSRLRDLVQEGSVSIYMSPYERTHQTLLGLYEGGFPEEQVKVLRVDPRIREKEFGNFQTPGTIPTLRAEEKLVGPFYYRMNNAESFADVLVRVGRFWDMLMSSRSDARSTETCLLVAHGLTIRLLLMKIFDWSSDTYEAVFGLRNCQHITLRKNAESRCYEFCPTESFPPHIPWSIREIFVRLKSLSPRQETLDELARFERWYEESEDPLLAAAVERLNAKCLRQCSKPYTIVDYLCIPQPRTRHMEDVMSRLVEGHGWAKQDREQLLAKRGTAKIKIDDIEFIDFWGDTLSYRGKMLRARRLRWL